MTLGGRVAIVSGAGPNIGREIASTLAANGARVVCLDVRKEAAEATTNELVDRGFEALAVQADTTVAQHLDEYTTPRDLFKVMNDRGFESPYLRSIGDFERLFWETFTAIDNQAAGYRDRFEWVLSVDSYFRLLEYEELNEARQSSKRALWVAALALIISSSLAITNIIRG